MKIGSCAAFYWVSTVAIAALATFGAQSAQADRNLLWNIVNFKCLRHLTKSEAPIPCDSVDVSKGWDNGAALLKDFHGVARMLAIPTHRVTGIEDPTLLAPDEIQLLHGSLGGAGERRVSSGKQTLPREAVAITVDSMVARGQDQLHLQIDCLDKDVVAALASYPDAIGRSMALDDGRTQGPSLLGAFAGFARFFRRLALPTARRRYRRAERNEDLVAAYCRGRRRFFRQARVHSARRPRRSDVRQARRICRITIALYC